jgi:hypothetical protein
MPNDSKVLEQGVKYDFDKIRLELLPLAALEEIGKVFTFGAKKYEDRNWEKGILYSRVFGALLRHLFLWWCNKTRDDETGINHLAHAGCCLLFLLHYEQYPYLYKKFDDRPNYSGVGK